MPNKSNRAESQQKNSVRAQIHSSRFAVATALKLIRQFLTFLEIAHPCPLDGGNMNENVGPAFIGLNKSVALLGIEPLYGTSRHQSSPKQLKHSQQQSQEPSKPALGGAAVRCRTPRSCGAPREFDVPYMVESEPESK
jgi:hypothetical protein